MNEQSKPGKARKSRPRLTGISAPFGGLQWDYRTSELSDSEIVARLFHTLRARRVLWEKLDYEEPDYCARSVIEIRNFLTDLGKEEVFSRPYLLQSLENMRSACNQFLTAIQISSKTQKLDECLSDLTRFRILMRCELMQLGESYDVEIPEELSGFRLLGHLRHIPQASRDDRAVDAGTNEAILHFRGWKLTFPSGETFSVADGELVEIGRDSRFAKTVFVYSTVSRHHATLGVDPGGEAWIKDEKSANGTFVNDVRLQPDLAHPIYDGDAVRLGYHGPEILIERIDSS
jgi:hypothetical protein